MGEFLGLYLASLCLAILGVRRASTMVCLLDFTVWLRHFFVLQSVRCPALAKNELSPEMTRIESDPPKVRGIRIDSRTDKGINSKNVRKDLLPDRCRNSLFQAA